MDAVKNSQRVGPNPWMTATAVMVAALAISTLYEGRVLIVQALLPTWYQAFGDELFVLFAGVALFMRGHRRLFGSVLVLTAIWMLPLVWWVMSGAEPNVAVAVASEAHLVAVLMILTAAGLIAEEVVSRRYRRASARLHGNAALSLMSTQDGANHG